MAIEQQFLSPRELAKYLGISLSAIVAYRTDGNGPAYLKVGRLVRYRISDVEKWLDENNPTISNKK
jgi:excisionase family DNA binding protein